MSKQPTNRRQKYMDTDDFIKFGQTLKVTISPLLLEETEKQRLFLPTYRTLCPREYVEASWKGETVDADLWKEIAAFDHQMEILRIPSEQANEKLLNEEHPLDVAWGSKKAFLIKPEEESFRPWKEYEVALQYPEGEKTTRKCAWAFYEPWQIYHLDEITTNLLGQRRWALLRGDLSMQIHNMPMFKSRVMQYQDMYRILANYQYRCQLLFEKAFIRAEKQGTAPFIEGETYQEYKKYIHNESVKAFQKATEERWIEFIKDLSRIYFQYQEREKEGFKSVVKSDLHDACQVVIDALGWDYIALAEKVGQHIAGRTFIGKFALEHIFPEPEMELIRKSSQQLSSFAINYIKATGKPADSIGQTFLEEFIRDAIKRGNDALIVKIIETNDEWLNRSLHHGERLWTCLRTLSVAVEVLGKDLGFGDDIGSILNKVMDNKFESSVRTPLNNKWQKSGQPGSVDETDTPQGLIKRIDFIRANPPQGIGQHLITTKLLRNYLSHNTAIDVDLLGERFIFPYRSLVLTALYLFENQKRLAKVPKSS